MKKCGVIGNRAVSLWYCSGEHYWDECKSTGERGVVILSLMSHKYTIRWYPESKFGYFKACKQDSGSIMIFCLKRMVILLRSRSSMKEIRENEARRAMMD